MCEALYHLRPFLFGSGHLVNPGPGAATMFSNVEHIRQLTARADTRSPAGNLRDALDRVGSRNPTMTIVKGDRSASGSIPLLSGYLGLYARKA